jgi:hypothetical protein
VSRQLSQSLWEVRPGHLLRRRRGGATSGHW